MPDSHYTEKSYFELSKHSFAQLFVFFLLLTGGILLVFALLFPLLENFFVKFLSGVVHNNGEKVSYLIESKSNLQSTNYFFNWAVDVYKDTPQESRYWFNPVLSFISFTIIIGSFLAIIISALMPISLGYICKKIEREIANLINAITVNAYGDYTEDEQNEIVSQILKADLRQMYEYSDEWGISVEDLKILQRAIIWRNSSILYKILHLNDGLTMYMRFYFTARYGNTVLGLVYIGAAVLIIIVGLRGLKFIPPTQPSVVLFALGLEFSLLVIYAFSLIYTKQEEEEDVVKHSEAIGENMFLGSDFGSSREIEKLLRVFIKSNPRKTSQKK